MIYGLFGHMNFERAHTGPQGAPLVSELAMRTLISAVFFLVVLFGVATFTEGNASGPEVLRGMYSYMADAALFTDCRTGRSYPVALEGDNRMLERAYMATPHEPGEALLVTLEGRIVERMPMEGPGPVPTLLPEKFLGISPGTGCDMPGR